MTLSAPWCQTCVVNLTAVTAVTVVLLLRAVLSVEVVLLEPSPEALLLRAATTEQAGEIGALTRSRVFFDDDGASYRVSTANSAPGLLRRRCTGLMEFD